MDAETSRYSPAFTRLLIEQRLPPLGRGTANAGARAELDRLSAESAFAPAPVRNPAMAQACLAGIWLYQDFLEESHRISQAIDTPSGSFWHAIMHRREPDAWNSKYWFRRVGTHPIFPGLREAAERLLGAGPQPPEAAALFRQSCWDPFAFVDLCEQTRAGNPGLAQLCRQIQAQEWRLLFDFCYRQAVGQPA